MSELSRKMFVPAMIGGMLITGCANSLFTKYQDNQCVENCDAADPSKRVLFEQPVWQALQMFVGEMLCFLPLLYNYLVDRYHRSRQTSSNGIQLPPDGSEETPLTTSESRKAPRRHMRGWSVLLMWIPAACDLTGTTLMMVGLLWVPVSIYQMTRGALVLWVGLFSVMFLRRKLYLYQWLALVTVMMGICIVGLSASLAKDSGRGEAVGSISEELARIASRVVRAEGPEEGENVEAKVLVGILVILFAQIFTAAQFVVEEKIMGVYTLHPLLAVGYEGIFGFLTIIVLSPVLVKHAEDTPFFDLGRGWTQMMSSFAVIWSSVAIMISIGLFNAFGLSVTRYVSAAARSTADSCRTIGIWAISLLLGWEKLTWPWTPMQLLGFALLVYGTFVFNDLIEPPKFLRPRDIPSIHVISDDSERDEQRALLAEQSLDATATLPADLGQSGFDVVPPPSSSAVSPKKSTQR